MALVKDRHIDRGFPDSSVGKESTCNAGDPGSIPRSGGYAGKGIGYPLQYSSLEHSTDGIVHGVANSQTQWSDFHFHFQTHDQQNRIESRNIPAQTRSIDF